MVDETTMKELFSKVALKKELVKFARSTMYFLTPATGSLRGLWAVAIQKN